MKLIYLTVDGRARVENAVIQTRMVEMPDGYHPVTNDSVWQDSKRQRPGVLIIPQGVLGGYGAHMTEENTLSLLFEIDVAEKALKRQNVSKMWQRAFARFVAWGMKYGVLTFIIVLIGVSIYRSLTEGG